MRKLVPLILLVYCVFAFGAGPLGEQTSEDLRLRLRDPGQESRTTSLNWFDLKPIPRLEAATSPAAEPPQPPGPKNFRIVIDAGHGGRDLGAIGFGLLEKDLSLKISYMVRRELERYQKVKAIPLEVRLSRSTDDFVPLDERVRIANEWGADLFVSIHGNAAEYPRAHGFEVYFLNAEASDKDAKMLARFENSSQDSPIKSNVLSILTDSQVTQHISDSSLFAETIYQALSRRFRANGRGVRQAPFKVLHGTQMPAVLVEVGYISDKSEAKNLTKASYLKRLANAISTGIIDFVTSHRKII